MKVICAPDSYKEALSAVDAAAALARGVRAALPDAVVAELPMADGGEGTTRTLMAAMRGEVREVECVDALGRPRRAELGWVADDALAVVETAEGAGLQHIAPGDRDPWISSSAGVGVLIRSALDLGAKRIIIGLGGSATNDGGAGMLAALGARFLDADGQTLSPTPRGLQRMARVELGDFDERLNQVEVTLASDVTNPLLGDDGATRVFGPQKGVTAERLGDFEAVLTRLADALAEAVGREVRATPGAGAAGGLGAAFLATTSAVMRPGIEVVAEAAGLDAALKDADWVFTGEGRIDAQTRFGKTPWGVAEAARRHGVPVVFFGGSVTPEGHALADDTIAAVVSIQQGVCDLNEALEQTAANLEATAASVTALVARASASSRH